MPALHTESENKDHCLTSLYSKLNLINIFLGFFLFITCVSWHYLMECIKQEAGGTWAKVRTALEGT